MAEEFYLDNAHPALELQGRGTDLLLLFRGRLAQLTFLREVGTTWRYQLARNVSEPDVVRDERFRAFVRAGQLSNDALRQQFDYLLSRLAGGLYRVEIDYFYPDTHYLPTLDRPDCYTADFYGGLFDIMATQAYHDPAVVAEYEQLIRAGAQPIMVLLTAPDSPTRFILDGHHKFRAYAKLQTRVRALVITRLNAKPLDIRRGMELLLQCPDATEHFRNCYLSLAT